MHADGKPIKRLMKPLKLVNYDVFVWKLSGINTNGVRAVEYIDPGSCLWVKFNAFIYAKLEKKLTISVA